MPKRRSSKKRNISQKQLAALARGRKIRANNIRIRKQNGGGGGAATTPDQQNNMPVFTRAGEWDRPPWKRLWDPSGDPYYRNTETGRLSFGPQWWIEDEYLRDQKQQRQAQEA